MAGDTVRPSEKIGVCLLHLFELYKKLAYYRLVNGAVLLVLVGGRETVANPGGGCGPETG